MVVTYFLTISLIMLIHIISNNKSKEMGYALMKQQLNNTVNLVDKYGVQLKIHVLIDRF